MIWTLLALAHAEDTVLNARADQYLWSSSGFSLPQLVGTVASDEVFVVGRGAIGVTDQVDLRAAACLVCTALLFPAGLAAAEVDLEASERLRFAANVTVGGTKVLVFEETGLGARAGGLATWGSLRHHLSLGAGAWYTRWDEPGGHGPLDVTVDTRLGASTRVAEWLALVAEAQAWVDPEELPSLYWATAVTGAAARILFDPITVDLAVVGHHEQRDWTLLPWLEVAVGFDLGSLRG